MAKKKSKSASDDKNKVLAVAIKFENICVRKKMAGSNDKLIQCHNQQCPNCTYFHLLCMGYKRYPNNVKTSWICPGCKVQGNKLTTSTPTNSINPDEKTLYDILSELEKSNFDVLNSDETGSSYLESSMLCSNFDMSITNTTVADDIDKTSSLGTLTCTNKEFAIIESSTGWLDCVIIHQAQVLLKQLNPNIEGFQRTTLGPVRNFDVIGGEFIQILHTSGNHWVCELHWLSERAC